MTTSMVGMCNAAHLNYYNPSFWLFFFKVCRLRKVCPVDGVAAGLLSISDTGRMTTNTSSYYVPFSLSSVRRSGNIQSLKESDNAKAQQSDDVGTRYVCFFRLDGIFKGTFIPSCWYVFAEHSSNLFAQNAHRASIFPTRVCCWVALCKSKPAFCEYLSSYVKRLAKPLSGLHRAQCNRSSSTGS